MTVSTPNTSTSGTIGTPSPAAIATTSLDGTQSPAASDHVQLMALVDQMRAYFAMIAQALSLSVDPGTGRIRVRIEDSGANIGGGIAIPVTFAASTTTTISNISATGAGGNKPDTLIFDTMQNAWANSAGLFVGRA